MKTGRVIQQLQRFSLYGEMLLFFSFVLSTPNTHTHSHTFTLTHTHTHTHMEKNESQNRVSSFLLGLVPLDRRTCCQLWGVSTQLRSFRAPWPTHRPSSGWSLTVLKKSKQSWGAMDFSTCGWTRPLHHFFSCALGNSPVGKPEPSTAPVEMLPLHLVWFLLLLSPPVRASFLFLLALNLSLSSQLLCPCTLSNRSSQHFHGKN